MTSFCFFVQLADRTLILKQKEFFVFIIATRLLWNHSPSEWFSLYKKSYQTFKNLIALYFYNNSNNVAILLPQRASKRRKACIYKLF